MPLFGNNSHNNLYNFTNNENKNPTGYSDDKKKHLQIKLEKFIKFETSTEIRNQSLTPYLK